MGALEPHPISPDLRPLSTKGFVQKGSGWEEAASKTDCVPQCGKGPPPTCQPILLHTCTQSLPGKSTCACAVPPQSVQGCWKPSQVLSELHAEQAWKWASFYEKQSGTEPEQKTHTEFYLSHILSLEPCLAHVRHPTNNSSPQICSS